MAKKENQTETNQVSQTRRRALLGVAGGAAGLAVWHRPVVNAVVLPAHAQTSPATMALTFFASGATATPIMVKSSPVDWLIPSAVASEVPITSEYSVSIAQTAPDTDNYQIDLFERQLQGEDNVGEFLYSGTASEATGGTLNIAQNPCERRVMPITVEIVSLSETSATLNLTGPDVSLDIPAGSGSLPTPVCDMPSQPESFFSADADPIPDLTQSATPGLLDMLVPIANAGMEQPRGGFGFSATKAEENFYMVGMLNPMGNVLREGILELGSERTLIVVEGCDTEGEPQDLPATITSISATNLTLNVTLVSRGTLSFNIPIGSGDLETNCEEPE